MVDFDNYKNELSIVMKDVCKAYRLFPNSLQLTKTNTKTDMLQGYRIQIFEEEYPADSSTPHEKREGTYDSYGIALIKDIVDEADEHYGYLLIFVRDTMKEYFEIPTDAELTKAPAGYFGFYILPDSKELMSYLKKLMEYRIESYRSSASGFGCCSSFNECSDAKHCVHYNQLYATSCIYRIQHLDKGEIFYGKNRNV